MWRARCAILVSLLLILFAGRCFAGMEEEEGHVVRPEFHQSASLLDSLFCGIQRLASALSDSASSLVSSLRRFSEARHRFYSHIWKKVLSTGSPFGNAGATEPTSIPEPPAIPFLRIELRTILERLLRQYLSYPLADAPTCLDVMKSELLFFEKLAIAYLDVYCLTDKPETAKFCESFRKDNQGAVTSVFSWLAFDPVHIVAHRVGSSGCEPEREAKVREVFHSTGAGLNQFAVASHDNPTLVFAFRASWHFKNNGGAHPHPFGYRRAMIFRSSGVAAELSTGSYHRLFFPLDHEMRDPPRSFPLVLPPKLPKLTETNSEDAVLVEPLEISRQDVASI